MAAILDFKGTFWNTLLQTLQNELILFLMNS